MFHAKNLFQFNRTKNKKVRSELHQLLIGFSVGDAISDYAVWLQRILIAQGYTSHIYARHFDARRSRNVHPANEVLAGDQQGDILFHYSIGSDILESVRTYRGRILMMYHNVTPSHFFARVNPHLSALQQQGIEALPGFVNKAAIALADSRFNAIDLARAGYANVAVQPIPFLPARFTERATRRFDGVFARFRTRLLFVGRVAPNKRHDQLVRIAARYIRTVDRDACLIFAGSFDGTEIYKAGCMALAATLEIADHVIFTGHVSQGDLQALYQAASVLVVASDHEGFCMPLLEAMHFGVPILAKRSSAVPDTLRGCGVLYSDDVVGSQELVEMLAMLVHDASLRDAITHEQRRALEFYDEARLADEFARLVGRSES